MQALDLTQLVVWAPFTVTNFGNALNDVDNNSSQVKSQLCKTSYRVLLYWTVFCVTCHTVLLQHSFYGELPGVANLLKRLAS